MLDVAVGLLKVLVGLYQAASGRIPEIVVVLVVVPDAWCRCRLIRPHILQNFFHFNFITKLLQIFNIHVLPDSVEVFCEREREWGITVPISASSRSLIADSSVNPSPFSNTMSADNFVNDVCRAELSSLEPKGCASCAVVTPSRGIPPPSQV